MKSLPVYSATMTGSWDEGIWTISLVDHPAFEHLFAKFEEVKPIPRVSFDKEQRIVVAPLMIPDKLIYRVDDYGNEFFVKFDKDTIREMGHKMMRQGTNNFFNLNHSDFIEGWQVSATEVWIKEFDEDKSNVYGFNCPKGTLFMSAKINDDVIWKKIINNELNGFSIEAYNSFKYEMEKYIYSAIEVGETVFIDKGHGIEKFSGKFNVDEKEVTVKDGKITEVEEVKHEEPKNEETVSAETLLAAVKALEEKFNNHQELANENKRLAEKMAMLELKMKQDATNFKSDIVEDTNETMNRLELIKKFNEHFKAYTR